MKRLTALISLIFPAIIIFSQESKWENIIIDKALMLSLPIGETTIFDTSAQRDGLFIKSHIIQGRTERCSFEIHIDSANIDLTFTKKSNANVLLEGTIAGICSSYMASGFSCERTDVIVDSIPGKKLCLFDKSILIYCYVFRINKKNYSIYFTAGNAKDELLPKELDEILNSINFDLSNIEESAVYLGWDWEAIHKEVGY